MKKTANKFLRFFALCCLYDLLLLWIDSDYVCKSIAKGDFFVLLPFIWAPVFVPLIHVVRINTSIIGNLFHELLVLVLPRILLTVYFYFAYTLADKALLTTSGGIWYFDITNVYIVICILILILLCVPGFKKTNKKERLKAYLFFIVILCLHVMWLLWNCQSVFYVPEIKMYVKTERMPFMDARMYFSKTDRFGTDYVKYINNTGTIYLDVRYTPPCTLCVSNATGIKQDYFKMIEYKARKRFVMHKVQNGFVPDFSIVYTDSTFIKKPSYHFSIHDNFSGFSIEDPEGNTVFRTDEER